MKNEREEYNKYFPCTPFPSPCGEKVMKNTAQDFAQKCFELTVSIPLRGKGYEKLGDSGWKTQGYPQVSIPLRGKGYEKQK